MKTELKLIPDNIILLSKLLSGAYTSQTFTLLEKVSKCNLMDVYDKVSAKAKELQRKQSLFDSKKKVTLSLKVSNAYYLYQFLINHYPVDNDYYKAQIEKIKNQLAERLEIC